MQIVVLQGVSLTTVASIEELEEVLAEDMVEEEDEVGRGTL